LTRLTCRKDKFGVEDASNEERQEMVNARDLLTVVGALSAHREGAHVKVLAEPRP
jgi:hypothetical protein